MVNRFVNNDQITFMGGANNTNNMGFSDLASTMFSGMGGGGGRRGGFGAVSYTHLDVYKRQPPTHTMKSF